MLFYFTAAGRNPYTKFGYVYLMMMQNLVNDHPAVNKGLSMVFMLYEEAIYRHGNQQIWILNKSGCVAWKQLVIWREALAQEKARELSYAEGYQATHEVPEIGFYTSGQHKGETKARQERKQKKVMTIKSVM